MNQYPIWAAIFFTVLSVKVTAQVASDSTVTPKPDHWAYEALNIPLIEAGKKSSPIVVAVVDDGFNLEHKTIKPHVFRNENESLTNNDDDGNSFKDDIMGWDIAENDNDVSNPTDRSDFFYHGTMVAGIIAQVAQRALGDKASELVKILPIKVLKDDDQKHDYTLGYRGIQYAIKMGADIIICAWGGGKYNPEIHDQVFKEADDQGIMVIAAAGNFYSERSDPPASVSSVYAISAFDKTFKKKEEANYGLQIDLSAAGEFVYAPHPAGNNSFGYLDGTSSATALIGGCAAVLKVLAPKAKKEDLMMALKNTAVPLDQSNMTFAGRLGAGYPNLKQAIEYLMDIDSRSDRFNSKLPEGSIVISKSSRSNSWKILPDGSYSSFNFSLSGSWPKAKDPIEFYTDGQLLSSILPQAFPPNLSFEASSIEVKFIGRRPNDPVYLNYMAVPMDSTTSYCSDVQHLTNEKGQFEDGSGDLEYANRSGCKWQITVPTGKRIWLDFDQFDTEANKDIVYIFQGNGTQQENLIAEFTGAELPPNIVSSSNAVLIWFVTNKSITAKGWHLNYWSTEDSPGIKGVRNH